MIYNVSVKVKCGIVMDVSNTENINYWHKLSGFPSILSLLFEINETDKKHRN